MNYLGEVRVVTNKEYKTPLQLENEILQVNNENKNLQARIDKAIEYIKRFNEPMEFFDLKELLDILQGSDKE